LLQNATAVTEKERLAGIGSVIFNRGERMLSGASARFLSRHHRWRVVGSLAVLCSVAGSATALANPAMRDVGLGVSLVSLFGLFAAVLLSARDQDRTERDQNLKLDLAIDSMSQGLCLFDAAAKLVLCNDRYRQMYGLTAEETPPGCSLRDLVLLRKAKGTFAGQVDEYVTRVTAEIRGGQTNRSTIELDDGRVISLVNTPTANGGWVATHEDITVARRREEELARTQQFLDMVIDNVPATIIVKNARDFRYVLINRPGD
jgi:PAS domain-containing protein